MSELTICNYCRLKNLEARANREKKIVCIATGVDGSRNFKQGKDVHLVESISEKLTDRNFVMWCSEIGNICEC